MKVSLITTVYNEEASINSFLRSISLQTRIPDEVIITDAGSSDKTIEKLKLFQRKAKFPVKIIIKRGNRAVGRNEAIKHARGEVIVCSDVGCVLDKRWLGRISEPFRVGGSGTDDIIFPAEHGRKALKFRRIDVASGYYYPKATNVFEKSLAAYTCVMPDKLDRKNFLPSSRSVAFRKSVWKKVGGYPEYLDTCEDLIFDLKLKKAGFRFVFVENALVYWDQRKNLLQAWRQFFSYAIGDGQAHFIRRQIPFLYLRYLLAALLLVWAIYSKSILLYMLLGLGFLGYYFWAVKKNYRYVKHFRAFFYLPLLQFTADSAVMLGTGIGLITSGNVSKEHGLQTFFGHNFSKHKNSKLKTQKSKPQVKS